MTNDEDVSVTIRGKSLADLKAKADVIFNDKPKPQQKKHGSIYDPEFFILK